MIKKDRFLAVFFMLKILFSNFYFQTFSSKSIVEIFLNEFPQAAQNIAHFYL